MALLSFVPGVFLISGGAIAGISVGAACVLAAIVVFFVFFYPKAKCRKEVNFCKKGYEDAHSLLTTYCHTKIERLSVLGKKSTEYAGFYEERKKTYDNLIQMKDVPLSRDIKRLTGYLENKEYHNIREMYSSVSRSIDEFTRGVNSMNAELTALLDNDTLVHSKAVPIKEKYRRIKEFYDAHKAELIHTKNSFDIILSKSEDAFRQFDSFADSGEFTKADEIVSQQDMILEQVIKIMDQLPTLEAMLNQVIPEKQKHMNEFFQQLLSEDYVLSHLDVEGLNQRIDSERKELNDRLSYMDVSGVREAADCLSVSIMDMEGFFRDEQSAKKTFLSSQNNILDSCFNTEKRYSELMNRLSEFQSTYVMNQKYIEQMKSLKSDIEAIGILKHDLDSYLDSMNKQPYSIIIKKMNDIENEMKKTENMMNEYQVYTDSLRKDAVRVYEGLRTAYVDLLKAQNTLRDISVEAVIKNVTPEFSKLYQQIAEIYKVVLTTPINVPLAVELYEKFQKNATELIEAVNRTSKEADEAESYIVYANLFHRHQEARQDLLRAQNEFSLGHFVNAAEIGKKVVTTFDTAYVGK